MKRNYFVTGATGVVGSALLQRLLESKENHIWALIRGDSAPHIQQRLQELMCFWGLDENQQKEALQRITLVQGDMDKPYFGITNHLYDKISQQCTHIIHCAGVVRMNLPLEVAITHAVGSTKNVVELALQCKKNGQLEKIDFVSTVGVGGKIQTAIPETWITEKREFHNTYEASKAEAEDYLREQIDKHQLPVTLHRPSMIVGNQDTGKIIHFQVFYYICEFLSGRRTLGILPSLKEATLDTVPVDYVAKTLKWSSEHSFCTGKIFHLSSGPEFAITLSKLKKQVREQFRNQPVSIPDAIISLPAKLFAIVIKLVTPLLNEKGKKASKAFPIFLDYLSDKQIFSNKQSTNFMYHNNGPILPNPSSYLETVIAHYLQKIE